MTGKIRASQNKVSGKNEGFRLASFLVFFDEGGDKPRLEKEQKSKENEKEIYFCASENKISARNGGLRILAIVLIFDANEDRPRLEK